MAARVDGPRNERFESDVPKDVHGLVKMDLHMCQCVDPKGYRRMVIVGKVGKKLYTFPAEFWDAMGVCPQWLEEQIRPMLFGEEDPPVAKTKGKSKTKAAKQLGDDNVDVMS
jgi:hypothetical protein